MLNHFPELASVGLTEEDRQVMANLLQPSMEIQPGVSIEGIVPESMDAQDLYRNLNLCCRAIGTCRRMESRLRPLVGRMLNVISDQGMYKVWGFKTFNDFILEDISPKLGIGRTIVFKAMKIASSLPSLSLDEYEKLGPTKTDILVKFTSSDQPSHQRFIEQAIASKSVQEFRTWAEEQGLVQDGETQFCVICIPTNVMVRNAWSQFKTDPRVHSYCGSDNEGQILANLIAEGMASWLQQGFKLPEEGEENHE